MDREWREIALVTQIEPVIPPVPLSFRPKGGILPFLNRKISQSLRDFEMTKCDNTEVTARPRS